MTLISSGAIDADTPDVLSVLERSEPKISRAQDLLKTARDDLAAMRSTYRSVERSRAILLLSQMIGGIELYERHR